MSLTISKDALAVLQLTPGGSPSAATMETVDKWLSLEENEEVSETIVADMVEDLCDDHVVEMNSDDDVDQIEQGKEGRFSVGSAPAAAAVRANSRTILLS